MRTALRWKGPGIVAALASAIMIAGCATGLEPSDSEEPADTPSMTTSGGGGAAASTSSSTTSVTSTSALSSTSATSVGAGPSATTTTSAASGGSAQSLGQTCAADADCGAAGWCLRPTDADPLLGGGPANGYCSAPCSTEAECAPAGHCAVDENGLNGRCLLDCALGPALLELDDPLDPTKCLAREDARCLPLGNGTAVCVPTCGSDAQCPSGHVCDPRSRVCLATPSTGKPNGETCNPAAQAECAGVCVAFTSGETMCSNPCVLGGDLDADDCGGLASGMCAFAPNGNGAGDYAYCAPACSAQSDCQNPSFWCFALEGVTGTIVPNGYCFGAKKCPNGDSDCTTGNGPGSLVCTDTPNGKLCLDSAFP